MQQLYPGLQATAGGCGTEGAHRVRGRVLAPPGTEVKSICAHPCFPPSYDTHAASVKLRAPDLSVGVAYLELLRAGVVPPSFASAAFLTYS